MLSKLPSLRFSFDGFVLVLEDNDVVAESLYLLVEMVDADLILFYGGLIKLGLSFHEIAVDLGQSLLSGLFLAQLKL